MLTVDERARELGFFMGPAVPETRLNLSAAVAVVAHDAGGAEVLARLTRDYLERPEIIVSGPARQIFARVLGVAIDDIPEGRTIDPRRVSQLLSSAGWQTRFEYDFISYAIDSDIHTAVVIDHWMNIPGRLERSGRRLNPEELWVSDVHAERRVAQTFPACPVVSFRNPVYSEFLEDYETCLPRSEKPVTALFISDNVAGYALEKFQDARALGFTQADALKSCGDFLEAAVPKIRRIIVRRHPSEENAALSSVIELMAQRFAIVESDSTLAGDVAAAHVVVGIQSSAMLLARLAGRDVYQCIPPGGRVDDAFPWVFPPISGLVASSLS